MRKFHFIFTAAAVTLIGCGEADQTATGFKTPTTVGGLSGNGGAQVRFGNDFSAVTGNGYAYQAGAIDEAGFQAFAGIVPGASVEAAPASATTATMRGQFEVAVVDAILMGGTTITGQNSIDSGSITLVADFQNGTLTGSGNGVDGGFQNIFLNENLLTIDGTFSGTTLTGTATYNGVSGPLRGLVGVDEAIGAFHGNDDGQVHAGGFIAD